MRRLALALVFVFAAVVARAQSVRWEPSDSGPGTLQLVFEDCAPEDQPELPSISGVTFTKIGESSSLNIVNFDAHRSLIYTYVVRSRGNGAVQIPAFSVKTNRGTMRVPAYSAGAPPPPPSSVASSSLTPEKTTVWAGEVFDLAYELRVANRASGQILPVFDWNPAPLTVEEWSKFESSEDSSSGERVTRFVTHTRATARTPNTVKLEAAKHLMSIQTGVIGTFLGPRARIEQISVTSSQPVITIRPLPDGAPAGFNGAVGEFELTSKIVPENANVGEPITWTLELKGTGNWPDFPGLPAREVSKDFQVVQPKAKRTPAEGKIFDVTLTEDVILMPTKTGDYTLGPIKFVYFDPKSGTYKTRTTEKKTIQVGTAAAPKFSINLPPPSSTTAQPAAGSSAPAAPTQSQIESLKSKIPTPPAGIPRDPLPGSDPVSAPLTSGTLATLALVPFALPLVVWVWLAIRAAQRTDPLRPRREARVRLASTLAQLRNDPTSPQLLLAWQRDTAVLWQLAHAAPPASAVGDAAWTVLWSECDRALYGAQQTLPADWIARAEAALEAKRVAGFNPARAFLPRNLFPFAALIALSLISIVVLRAADDPLAAYRRGDFAVAEKSWRAAVTAAPTDWIARHNLALALAQQDHAGEAAAHAAAAFVQNPAEPALHWHLVLAGEKAGFVPAPLAGFLSPGPAQALAQKASPAVWQRALIVAAIAVALALSALLVNAYGRRASIVGWVAGATIAIAVIVSAMAAAGWQAYGTAADARAVVVVRAGTLRSIPTEADTSQKMTPLAAGTVAIALNTFLDGRWTKLQFDNGQTGWVRTGELAGLWR